MVRTAVGSACSIAVLVALLPIANAEGLEAVQQILADRESSPVPPGWSVGGAAYSGSSPYGAGSASRLAIPGAIYISDRLMYLGDRVFYTFERTGPVSPFARLRYRLGNLDPDDTAAWTGLTPRRGQLEAGLGAVVATPVGLWTARFSSDISGRSRGTELLVNWAGPVVGERWMVMPGLGVLWRDARLANYYFGGVTPAEAAPGRPAYDTGSAWSIVPSLIASYRIDRNWIVGGLLSYERFSPAIVDSPLIGKPGRYDAGIGLGYVLR